MKKQFSKLFRKFLQLFGEYNFTKIMFFIKVGYMPNFKNPKTFNEKLNYIKLNRCQYKLRCKVADRLAVRDFVKEYAPECNLIDILYVGQKLNNKIWKSLDERFVIKANHGSGMVLVVNKKMHNLEEVNNIIDKWLATDYASIGYEWYYKKLDKKIIIEKFLDFNGKVPPDFKFFCFNGKVELIQVDLDRFNKHKRNLYDRSFNRINGKLLYEQGDEIPKPKMLNKAIEIAEKLSKKFDFIRVDLYLLEDKIYFGELTNIPGNGLERFYPKSLDYTFGNKLRIENE